MNDYYYKINNKYLECITDEEALERYGDKSKRQLIFFFKDEKYVQLISPSAIIDVKEEEED